MPSSGSLPLPSLLSIAMMSEVNSCPPGTPAEANPGRAAIAKNIELNARDFVGEFAECDLVAARGDLGKQLAQLILLGAIAAKERQGQRRGQGRESGS
jgi:hypothetical protein